MDLIKPNTCRTCAFRNVQPSGGAAQAQYTCRRFPPVAALGPINTPQGPQMAWQASFPVVLPNWSCGEFRPGIMKQGDELRDTAAEGLA